MILLLVFLFIFKFYAAVTEKFEHVAGASLSKTFDDVSIKVGTYGQYSGGRPSGRYYGGLWKVGDSAFLFGGRGFDIYVEHRHGNAGQGINRLDALNDVWEYNLPTDQWRWVAGNYYGNWPRFPQPPTYAVDYDPNNTPGGLYQFAHWKGMVDDELYVSMGTSDELIDSMFNDMWVFKTSRNQWKQQWYNPVQFDCSYNSNSFGSTPPAIVESSFVKYSESNVYLFGGFQRKCDTGAPQGQDSGTSNHLWEFDMVQNSWRHVNGTTALYDVGSYTGPEKIPPSRKAAHVWYHENILYLFGGFYIDDPQVSNGGTTLEDLWTFTETDGWIHFGGAEAGALPVGQPAAPDYEFSNGVWPRARQGGMVWVRGSYLYLFGGVAGSNNVVTGTDEFYGDLYVFSTLLGQWKFESGGKGQDYLDDTTNKLPATRAYSAGVVIYDDKVYTLGGGVRDFTGHTNSIINCAASYLHSTYFKESSLWIEEYLMNTFTVPPPMSCDIGSYYECSCSQMPFTISSLFFNTCVYLSTFSWTWSSTIWDSETEYCKFPCCSTIPNSRKITHGTSDFSNLCGLPICNQRLRYTGWIPRSSIGSMALYYFAPSVWTYGGFNCINEFKTDYGDVCNGTGLCAAPDECLMCLNGGGIVAGEATCSNCTGFHGDQCQCQDGYCLNGGECVGLEETCSNCPGFSGTRCQCVEGFCLNGGECVGKGMVCSNCPGYHGDQCQCLDEYCLNGGECVGVEITCSNCPGYHGDQCQCHDQYCLNGGKCVGNENICSNCSGFTGDRCQCADDFCLNGGECVGDEMICSNCTGFYGDRCQCGDDYCPDGGRCVGTGTTCVMDLCYPIQLNISLLTHNDEIRELFNETEEMINEMNSTFYRLEYELHNITVKLVVDISKILAVEDEIEALNRSIYDLFPRLLQVASENPAFDQILVDVEIEIGHRINRTDKIEQFFRAELKFYTKENANRVDEIKILQDVVLPAIVSEIEEMFARNLNQTSRIEFLYQSMFALQQKHERDMKHLTTSHSEDIAKWNTEISTKRQELEGNLQDFFTRISDYEGDLRSKHEIDINAFRNVQILTLSETIPEEYNLMLATHEEEIVQLRKENENVSRIIDEYFDFGVFEILKVKHENDVEKHREKLGQIKEENVRIDEMIVSLEEEIEFLEEVENHNWQKCQRRIEKIRQENERLEEQLDGLNDELNEMNDTKPSLSETFDRIVTWTGVTQGIYWVLFLIVCVINLVVLCLFCVRSYKKKKMEYFMKFQEEKRKSRVTKDKEFRVEIKGIMTDLFLRAHFFEFDEKKIEYRDVLGVRKVQDGFSIDLESEKVAMSFLKQSDLWSFQELFLSKLTK